MDDLGKVGIILGVIIVLMIIFLLGYGLSSNQQKIKAVESGHAEFYLDKDHNRQWRWNPSCKGKKDGKEEKVKSSE